MVVEIGIRNKMDKIWENWVLAKEVRDMIDNCQGVIVPQTREQLFEIEI